MVRIAICDDEIKTGAELERNLADIFAKLHMGYEIDVYFSVESLCRKLRNGASYELFFLDILFAQSEIDGVEVGRFIREGNQNMAASIVYISWEKSYAWQLFEVQPLNFLIKPLRYDKIEEVVRQYIRLSGLYAADFVYKKGHDVYKVKIKDMVCIESFNKMLRLHFADGRTADFYGTLKQVYEAQLHRCDFLYIHHSYIVNYDYVTALKFDHVLLANGATSLPVSKHRRNEVRDRYFAIMKRRTV